MIDLRKDKSSLSLELIAEITALVDSLIIPTGATYTYDYIDGASNARDLENFLDLKF